MTNEALYTIGELADASGVTPRTIRYYTAEGLLPPPDTRGRHALYGMEHLRRLQLIGRLKDAYLPLGEIKARIEQLTAEQVAQLLVEERQAPEEPASAADYIAQVLTSQSMPPAPRMLAETPSAYAGSGASAAPPAPAAPAAIGFRPQTVDAEVELHAPAPLPASAPAPARQASHAEALMPAAPAPSQGSLLRKLIPQRRERSSAALPPTSATSPEETWQRVTLAPGVELHLRTPAAPALRERIEQLLAHARELFTASQSDEKEKPT
jgi:DNA-binding transcriptional MerR regulator